MSLVCEMAAPFVANSAVEEAEVVRPFRGHTRECLRCQARHAAMTRIARQLAALAHVTETAPLDLEWRVMSALEGDLAVVRDWRKPIALAAALASMATAILIWRLRLRPRTS